VALALAACGDEDDNGGGAADTATTQTETTDTAGAAAATVNVSETEYKLDPANPNVSKAGLVRFVVKNDGKVAHALEVEGPGEEVETESIAPGKSATLEANLNRPGRYEWYCPIGNHRELGMEGEITVAGGGSSTTEDSSTGEDETTTEDEPGSGKGGSGGDDDGGSSGPGSY
jgi:uncharacterized cupredoxin-like copper-binding protein